MTLSVEAHKHLTIGVELASKPALLLFLDEPISGLDAQSAWNLVRLLRKLADQGQAFLCTIHQPSSLLFENFDPLLILETVYFGDIGKDSQVIRDYFSRNGALRTCTQRNTCSRLSELGCLLESAPVIGRTSGLTRLNTRGYALKSMKSRLRAWLFPLPRTTKREHVCRRYLVR